ncbi:MAG: MBL fold metallo-hydrolase [Ruminiclostridium sp.]
MSFLRIVSLSDDETSDSKLFSEHGICLYIEHGNNRILFGTGASALFLSNAERLGMPADKADTVVLPLNCNDIAGGVETAVRKNKDVRIFIREDAAADCVKKEKLLRVRNGLPQSFYKSDKYNVYRFERFTEICKDFYLVAVDSKEKSGDSDRRFYIRKKGFYVPDDFSEECFAVCFPGKRRDGFVLITGGAYTGIADIVKTAKRLWDAPVLSVVGCFGYANQSGKLLSSQSSITRAAEELSKLRTGSIYTCHNTGRKGYDIMKDILGDRLQYLRAGEELNF